MIVKSAITVLMNENARESIDALVARSVPYSDFTSEVMAEVRNLLSHHGIDDPKLEDLREMAFVTIDNEDTRDLDQALFVERLVNGWRVFYALADASFYVRPGTAIWEEALRRGTSLYLPDRVIPMLPFELSEGLISLNPKVDRRALVFEIDVDDTGHVGSVEVKRARIHSKAKLSYDGVQRYLDQDGEHEWDSEPWADSLRELKAVALARIDAARDRDALEFDRFDLNLSVDPSGQKMLMVARQRNDVERYNEQISLLTNMEGARLLHEKAGPTNSIQSVFRVHLPPISERLRNLRKTLRELADAHHLDDSWTWQNSESLSEFLARLPGEPEYARLRTAIERQVRAANRSSHFSPHAGPHFALGVDHYARFTAPMREIVGIFTHKELLEGLGMERAEDNLADEALRELVIQAAHEGNSRQKTVDKESTLFAIQQELLGDLELDLQQRPMRVGTIVAIRSTRMYVLLDGLPMEVKVYTECLEEYLGEPFEASDVALSSPSFLFRLGQEVRLRTQAWDQNKRRVVLVPVSPD